MKASLELLKKQQKRYRNEDEEELMKMIGPEGAGCEAIIKAQKDLMLRVIQFTIKNRSRAARMLVIEGMMSMEDYLSGKW